MMLEDEFDLDILDDIARTFKAVGDIITYLQEKK